MIFENSFVPFPLSTASLASLSACHVIRSFEEVLFNMIFFHKLGKFCFSLSDSVYCRKDTKETKLLINNNEKSMHQNSVFIDIRRRFPG